jgi:hypothetical protein
LVDAINTGDTSKIWMAIPEIVDWEQVENFAYRIPSGGHTKAGPTLYPEIDLDAWLNETKLRGHVTVAHLRNRKVFPQYYSAITSEPCVVRSHPARLYPQREAGQSAIVDLKRFALRLGLFAREQRRSDEGLHDETPRMGSGKPGREGPRL